MKKIKLSLSILLLIITSIYATELIDRYTINSMLQYSMVLIYFLIISLVIYIIYITMSRKQTNTKLILIAVFTSIILTLIARDAYDNHRYLDSNIVISALGTKNDQSGGSEVWITKILVDGRLQDLSRIETSSGWVYQSKAIVSSENQPAVLELKLPRSKDISVFFLRHEWSGEASIKDRNELINLDLYSKDSKDLEYIVKNNENEDRSLLSKIAVIFGAGVFNFSWIFIVIWAITTYQSIKKPRSV